MMDVSSLPCPSQFELYFLKLLKDTRVSKAFLGTEELMPVFADRFIFNIAKVYFFLTHATFNICKFKYFIDYFVG